ncbi:MAG: hypothetical protein A3F12_06305 [Gammaproteobacteria bacterium RIFCSPHIGHO2_12_FULL_38_14]|nr:MAG: hypothetical protein A3F12_06305 [Gammaproteobacteria bacterium RIFCSPHIGHO2_12_FULL_38_14]
MISEQTVAVEKEVEKIEVNFVNKVLPASYEITIYYKDGTTAGADLNARELLDRYSPYLSDKEKEEYRAEAERDKQFGTVSARMFRNRVPTQRELLIDMVKEVVSKCSIL